jgi:hypothetical protein
MIEIKDLRSGERFVVTDRLTGNFNTAEVAILNVAHQGAQIEHGQPVRLSSEGRLTFHWGEIGVSVRGVVVWSRLSKTPNHFGKYLYRSGLRIDETNREFLSIMETLANWGVIRQDVDSLERKRLREEEKAQQKNGQPTMKFVPTEPEVSSDQVLLIEHARDRLRTNFDEAQKWYSRAYFALRDGRTPVSADLMKYPEDVLAVWEYLERSVPLSVIAKVFAKTSS